MKKTLTGALTIMLLGASIFSCKKTEEVSPTDIENKITDVNDDGKLNILVLGTSQSINDGSQEFNPSDIATELNSILSQDSSLDLEINIVAEDMHKSSIVSIGFGQGGSIYNWTCEAHSLMQYYYWPEGQSARWLNLSGKNGNVWDYVVVCADPNIVAKMPGYYALGVNKIASKIVEGGAKVLLLMEWGDDATIDHYAEYTYRVADGASVDVETIPAGRAWDALSESKKGDNTIHPTPNGAYVAAASIYSHLSQQSAAISDYVYDDEIAEIALVTKNEEDIKTHFSGSVDFSSPFSPCDISASEINYNHTGSSSENGILSGLNWVFGQSNNTLENNGTDPIEFNYGRANTNFEANKRYNIDQSQFQFSFGFPMQDDGSTGNTSMLYGIDKRINNTENGTDLGAARYMIDNNEIPYARVIPIRTLFAQLLEAMPGQSGYSDSWHMHGNLDKASAAYIYTILTGKCALGTEPSDQNSNDWKAWKSKEIGHKTANTVMTLSGDFSTCD